MTDEELIKRCREIALENPYGPGDTSMGAIQRWNDYDPLIDDVEAMSLVKQFGLTIDPADDKPPFEHWRVCAPPQEGQDWDSNAHAESSDLNRAICECVAKLKQGDKA